MSINHTSDRNGLRPADLPSDIPTGTLTLEKYEGSEQPIDCTIPLNNDVLTYGKDGIIAAACNIKRPLFISLTGAPSALTLRFSGGKCYDSDPNEYTFKIELKTTNSLSTTEPLLINDILKSATPAHDGPNPGDGVVVPGLRVLSVLRAPATGPGFNYIEQMTCIHIYRSGE